MDVQSLQAKARNPHWHLFPRNSDGTGTSIAYGLLKMRHDIHRMDLHLQSPASLCHVGDTTYDARETGRAL